MTSRGIRSALAAALGGLAVSTAAAASGSLLDDAILVMTFANGTAAGQTDVTADNDGTYLWTMEGGSSSARLARYLQDGTFDQSYAPGFDGRSLSSDSNGNLFGKAYAGEYFSITQDGVATSLFMLGDPDSQSGASLNADDSVIYTMSKATLRSWNAADGAPLGEVPLIGWGSIGNETSYPDNVQMSTTGDGRILTYSDGIVSEWDLGGNRIGMCNVPISTKDTFNTTWSFGVGSADSWVYLLNESTDEWEVYEVLFSGEDIGTNYCSPANFNSTGQSAVISGFGSKAVSKNAVTLTASLLPQNVFGYFLNSDVQDFKPFPPGSSGNLCLGGGIGRHAKDIANTGGAGELVLDLDLTMLPRPGGAHAVVAGETWNFQCWFRDKVSGQPTSNFTDGLSITFQ